MRNPELAADHVCRAAARLLAVDTLHEAESWADVVRESQEVVELALKGLLHAVGIAPPRVHDVAGILEENRARLPAALTDGEVARLCAASRDLRRDRELAYLGEADLVPSKFYRREHADAAREAARMVVALVRGCLPED